MNEILKTIKFNHRLLIIACLTIISFTLVSQQNVNFYRYALEELDKIESTFKSVKFYYKNRIKLLNSDNTFIKQFRSQFIENIDSTFTFSFIPKSYVGVNDTFDVIWASAFHSEFNNYFNSEKSLQNIYKDIDDFRTNYQNDLVHDIFIHINPDIYLLKIKNKLDLDKSKKIINLKSIYIRELSGVKIDTLGFLDIKIKNLQKPRRKPKTTRILVKIAVEKIASKIDSILIKKSILKFHDDKFKLFPNLQNVWKSVKNLNINQARTDLSGLSLNWDSNYSNNLMIFGIQLKGKSTFIFLIPLILIALIFYLIASILHLLKHKNSKTEIIIFPWVGIFQNKFGKIITFFSIFILPIITCILLFLQIQKNENLFIFIFIIYILIIIILSSYCLIKIRALNQYLSSNKDKTK